MSESDFIDDFISAMAAQGCEPAKRSDIIADDKWHRYTVAGDKKPEARYRLAIDGDFAYGCFVYFKHGMEATPWHAAKKGKKLTPEERKAMNERREAEKLRYEQERQEEYERVALECQKLWASGKEKAHPYLNKKGIASTKGTRVVDSFMLDGKEHKNVLLLPMWKNGKISSLQRIYKNGFKAFYPAGDVNGAYTAFVEQTDDKSTIFVCEGYATGDAIRQAFPDNPVVVAYTAGNLEAVCKLFREKYPASRFVICADNDQWTLHWKHAPKGLTKDELRELKNSAGNADIWGQWRAEGRMYNTGIDKATQAGVKIGAHVIFPDIPADDPDKGTDFDDLKRMRGVDAVRDRILAAVPASPPQDRDGASVDSPSDDSVPPSYFDQVPMEIYEAEAKAMQSLYEDMPEPDIEPAHDYPEDDQGQKSLPIDTESKEVTIASHYDWRDKLKCGEKGHIRTSLFNAGLVLENEPKFKGMFAYNEFSHEKMITKCPPWEDEQKFEPRPLRDEDITEITRALEDSEEIDITINIGNCKKLVDSIVLKNRRNPAQEYIKRLHWDDVPRLDNWLVSYCNATGDDFEYISAVGSKWIMALVARIMRPGIKFENILILEGKQDVGKSTLLQTLATVHGKPYFEDGINARQLGNPNTIMKLQGVMIVELQEMTGWNKMEPDEAKQVLSVQRDRIIKKYHNEPTEMPRQFVFAGTINPIEGFLSDPTGERRFWPVSVGHIDIERLKKEKEQLLAEAYHRWKKGEAIWMDTPELKELAAKAAERRKTIHPLQIDLEKLTTLKDMVTMEEVWDALVITDRTRRTKDMQRTISGIMMQLGFKQGFEHIGNVHTTVYRRENKPQGDFFDQQPINNMPETQEEDITW